MITVNTPAPGSFAPNPKLTLPGGEGKVAELPFSRMSRVDRLKLNGKYDATEEVSDTDDANHADPADDDNSESADITSKDAENGTMKSEKKEKVKMKMRGRNKSMKRWVTCYML